MNNISNYFDSRFTAYDTQKYDAFIPTDKKIVKDTFYYEDGVNLSSKNSFNPKTDSPNFMECLLHRNDDIKNMGYDFRKGILKKAISGIFFMDSKRTQIINQFDKLFIFMVDHIKSIKKTYNFLLPKNYRDFN